MNLQDWSAGVIPEGLEGLLPTPREMPSARMPLRDSPDTARGYREVDVQYSCVPDSVYPWDAEKVRAIREFLPDAVPMWVHWVFLEPNTRNPVVFGRHALGRAIREPGRDLATFRCLMPTMPCQGLTFEKPNRIWFIHEGDRNQDYPDIPGTFLPFNDSIVHRARESARYMQLSAEEFKKAMVAELVDGPLQERETRKRDHDADMEARHADFERYARSRWDQLSDVEIAEFQRTRGQRGREKKTMVFHGQGLPLSGR